MPSVSRDPRFNNLPSANSQASNPTSGSNRAEQSMPLTMDSITLKDRSEYLEFMEADQLSPDGQFVASLLPEAVTDGADMSLPVAFVHSQQALRDSTLWTDSSQWLDDLHSLDTVSGADMEEYMSRASIASPVHYQSISFQKQSADDAEDQEHNSSEPACNPHRRSPLQAVSQTGVRRYRSSTPQTLTHVPTFLIDYWFQSVCATWNGFDSDKNMNRNVAMELFPHSEGLAYSLQSMAAAYLAEQLPHFRKTTISMTQAAVQAIRRDLNQTISPQTLPRDLLLSMFCIGTSACWTDPLQFGLPFLKEIKVILRNYNQSKALLSPGDQNALAFFNNSALYWDMLCSIIGTENTGGMDPLTLFPSLLPSLKSQDALHPWTGVSAGLFFLFSESLSLCRRFRFRMTQNHRPTTQSLQASLRDIKEAQNLDQRLESFSIPNEWEIADTEDELTPKSHLIQIAEAYRLAALVHLRQTFPDLIILPAPEDGGCVDSDEHVLCLGLEIVRILENIPLTSGSRCIQPLLCLTAGTVLKLDFASVEPQQHALSLLNDILSADLRGAAASTSEDIQYEVSTRDMAASPEVSKRSIEVGQARRFLLERFSVLESSLPPKPIRVATQLILTIWAAYDKESPNTNQVHWIDIMNNSNLRTIFG